MSGWVGGGRLPRHETVERVGFFVENGQGEQAGFAVGGTCGRWVGGWVDVG